MNDLSRLDRIAEMHGAVARWILEGANGASEQLHDRDPFARMGIAVGESSAIRLQGPAHEIYANYGAVQAGSASDFHFNGGLMSFVGITGGRLQA